jgi:hypothetical protein
MYASVIPGYNDKEKDKKEDNDIINADDPVNRDKILSILNNAK